MCISLFFSSPRRARGMILPVSAPALASIVALLLGFCLVSDIAHARPETAAKTAGAADRFAEMDENNDGKRSREEFVKALPQIREEAFEAMDEDKDGFLSKEEWDKAMSGHSMRMPPAGMPGEERDGAPGRAGPPSDGDSGAGMEAGKKKAPQLIMPPKKDAGAQ